MFRPILVLLMRPQFKCHHCSVRLLRVTEATTSDVHPRNGARYRPRHAHSGHTAFCADRDHADPGDGTLGAHASQQRKSSTRYCRSTLTHSLTASRSFRRLFSLSFGSTGCHRLFHRQIITGLPEGFRNWPLFHNGVAVGLQLSWRSISRNWIVYALSRAIANFINIYCTGFTFFSFS